MDLRRGMLERHWGYMDHFADRMVARGSTFADDGTLTGSVHIVDLPDVTAARAFAFDEPGYQAGVYRDVMLRRWRNVSGRRMWDFVSKRPGRERLLVLGLGGEGAPDTTEPPGLDLIACGPLLPDDARTILGSAPIAVRGSAELKRGLRATTCRDRASVGSPARTSGVADVHPRRTDRASGRTCA